MSDTDTETSTAVDDGGRGGSPRTSSPWRPSVDRLVDDERLRNAAGWLAGALFFYFVVQRLWPAPIGVLLQGVVVGGLTALIAFGIALIYRANRIVNFAQGDMGALPASLAVLLMVGPGLPYFLAVPVGIAAGITLGGLVEFLIIRRFFKAPRLVLTVVTIGLSQLLAGLGFLLPRAFDIRTPPQSFPSPFDVSFRVGRTVFTGNDVIAMVAVVVLIAGLGAFFRYTNIGIAVRASAESADRASLLGVPVKRIETVVWVVAALLATAAVFLRAGVMGLPFGQLVGPALLVRALAAAVVGRMERFSVILVASIALGMVEMAIIFSTGSGFIVDPILFLVIVGGLLLQRRGRVARADEASSWQAARDVRVIPRELARLPEVRWGVRGMQGALLAAALLLPLALNEARIGLATVIMLLSIVGLSLVVLTGWAGQVSLGQIAFYGIGAAIASHITTAWGWDLSIAILLGGGAGAAAAMVIGLPALRIRGLYLAVTTLAFALATSSYLLNDQYLHWLPDGRFDRPLLFGRVTLDSEDRYYYLALVALILAIAAVRGLRRSRTGRVLIGVRENERAAQAFGVSAVGAKLTAFAVSGFLAAAAGAIFVHHQQHLGHQPYSVGESFQIFVMVVVGGLSSPAGAIIGVTLIQGVEYFQTVFPPTIREFLDFFTGPVGLIFVLMMMPGGLSQALYGVRDRLLRAAADRRGIIVPSLVADVRADRPAIRTAGEGVPGPEPAVEVDLVLAMAESAAGEPDSPAVDDLVGAAAGESGDAVDAPPRRRREPLRARRES